MLNNRYTKNFLKKEFKCKHCQENTMDGLFMDMLQQARTEAMVPFRITSGRRCPYWNAKIGGKPDSSHLLGIAADIACDNSKDRGRILTGLYHAGFRRVGIQKDFIHADIGDLVDNKPPGAWLYV
jgi:zinc D-Ala-D-Ala carboxypeptidase